MDKTPVYVNFPSSQDNQVPSSSSGLPVVTGNVPKNNNKQPGTTLTADLWSPALPKKTSSRTRSVSPFDLNTPVPVPRKSIKDKKSSDYYNMRDHHKVLNIPLPIGRDAVEQQDDLLTPVSLPPPNFPPPKPPRKCLYCNDICDGDPCLERRNHDPLDQVMQTSHDDEYGDDKSYDDNFAVEEQEQVSNLLNQHKAEESPYILLKDCRVQVIIPNKSCNQKPSHENNNLSKRDIPCEGASSSNEATLQIVEHLPKSKPVPLPNPMKDEKFLQDMTEMLRGKSSIQRSPDSGLDVEVPTESSHADNEVDDSDDADFEEDCLSGNKSVMSDAMNMSSQSWDIHSPPPPVPPRKLSAPQVNSLETRTSEASCSLGDEDGSSIFGTFLTGKRLEQYQLEQNQAMRSKSISPLNLSQRSFLSSPYGARKKLEVSKTAPIARTESISSKSSHSTHRTSPVDNFDSGSIGAQGPPLPPKVRRSSSNCSRYGYLYKAALDRKHLEKRWFNLDYQSLSYYRDEPDFKNGSPRLPKSSPSGVILLKDINIVCISFSPALPVKPSSRLQRTVSAISIKSGGHSNLGSQLFYFEVGVNNDKEKGRMFLFAADNEEEGRAWIYSLTHALSPSYSSPRAMSPVDGKPIIPPKLIPHPVDASGYLKTKTFVSGIWSHAFVTLSGRSLKVVMLSEHDDGKPPTAMNDVLNIDLRKVVSVTETNAHKVNSCPTVKETGQPIAITGLKDLKLYLQSERVSQTKLWLKLIHEKWQLPVDSGIQDQYLTADDVPLAIDKCLNFIWTHGGMSTKGIFRHSGQMSTVRTILKSMKSSEVWDLHLIPENGILIHDVVSAFKMYIRSFPECVVGDYIYERMKKVNEIARRDSRLTAMKRLLEELPVVNYSTLKRIVCHLVGIVENADKNEMSLIDLAPVVAPVLFYSSSHEERTEFESPKATDLLSELVSCYTRLFDVSPEEMEKERQIIKTLSLLRETNMAASNAGDILVGIYMDDRKLGACINVRLSPTMTSHDLIQYILRTRKMDQQAHELSVFEVCCDDQLERVLHWKEVVLGVVLSWTTNWGSEDAKNNYILVKDNRELFTRLVPFLRNSPSEGGLNTSAATFMRQTSSGVLFSTVKYSGTNQGKIFKKISIECQGARLNGFKVKDTAKDEDKPLFEWNIESIHAFMGCEKKRNPPTPFAFTFFDRHQKVIRNKESKNFVGRVACFSTEEDYYKWLAGLMTAEHPQRLLPPQKELIDFLS